MLVFNPISTYNFLGNHFKIPFIPYIMLFFNGFFFPQSPYVVHLFLALPGDQRLRAT